MAFRFDTTLHDQCPEGFSKIILSNSSLDHHTLYTPTEPAFNLYGFNWNTAAHLKTEFKVSPRSSRKSNKKIASQEAYFTITFEAPEQELSDVNIIDAHNVRSALLEKLHAQDPEEKKYRVSLLKKEDTIIGKTVPIKITLVNQENVFDQFTELQTILAGLQKQYAARNNPLGIKAPPPRNTISDESLDPKVRKRRPEKKGRPSAPTKSINDPNPGKSDGRDPDNRSGRGFS